jgi:hypothetical protein
MEAQLETQLIDFTPLGAWNCTDPKTNVTKACNVRVVKNSFVRGAGHRKAGESDIAMYVAVLSDVELVEGD